MNRSKKILMLNSIGILIVLFFSLFGFILTFNQLNKYGVKYEVTTIINNESNTYTVYSYQNYILSIVFGFVGSILVMDLKILLVYRNEFDVQKRS